MSNLPIKKRLQCSHMNLLCDSGGLLRKGYIGELGGCKNTMKVHELGYVWQGRYPDPMTSCGGGNREKDPRCAPVAPGASHPGVVMKDPYTYALNIDMP